MRPEPVQMKKSTVTYPDGLKYTGELKGDKRHGKGTLIFPNDGPKYIGEFKDNKMHGQGTITSWSRYYNIS